MAPLDIPSPICMTRSANGPHRIQSGNDSATDGRPTPFEFRFLQNAALSSCKFEVACLPAPHIEYRVSAEFATCLPNRGSGFPPLLSPAYALGGKEPVGPLCQHLNANFPVRALSLPLNVCRCRGLKTASGIAFAWKCVPRRRRGRRVLLRVYRASPKPLRKCKLRRRWLSNV